MSSSEWRPEDDDRPSEDPLEALRDEFEDVKKTAEELRDGARDAAIDEAGR